MPRPPRDPELVRLISLHAVDTVPCSCGAQPGQRCRNANGGERKPHFLRKVLAQRALGVAPRATKMPRSQSSSLISTQPERGETDAGRSRTGNPRVGPGLSGGVTG